MRKIGSIAFCFLVLTAVYLGCSLAQLRPPVIVEPEEHAVFTSTRSVTSLAVTSTGELWAATTGGVMRRSPAGVWLKYSRVSGLPSNEARQVRVDEGDKVQVLLPRATATFHADQWQVEIDGAPPSAPVPLEVVWGESVAQAAPDGFRFRPRNSMDWKAVPLPNSRGSHISALLEKDGLLWVALYGDGVWSYDGAKWLRLDIALPEGAREVTAMAFDEATKTLWLGTRRDGIWQYSLAGWRQHLQADEPFEHNAQNLAMYRGALFASTLEDGLQKRGTQGWQAIGTSTLSSEATRHLVEFRDKLFVRHGGGKVDAFDGKTWTRDVFASLPRKKAFALATDNQKLLAAQWGGWSEWDGKIWTHFLRIPELQGVPVMAILPVDDNVWIGTQSKGVGEYSHKTQSFKWHDERHGLPDDWITCLAKSGKSLFAGTFVGGMATFDGKHWKAASQLAGDNVTDLRADGQGGVVIATRRGVWHRDKDGAMQNLHSKHSWLDTEAQAVLPTAKGLWVGLRTGIAFVDAVPMNDAAP